MPRPCAVESHAHRYTDALSIIERCHGLAPWSLTLTATTRRSLKFIERCHGLAPWSLTLTATTRRPFKFTERCHGLAPWSLTLTATTKRPSKTYEDTKALTQAVSINATAI